MNEMFSTVRHHSNILLPRLITLLICAFYTNLSFALTCDYMPIEDAANLVDVVFVGTVESVEEPRFLRSLLGDDNVVVFSASRVWKGLVTETTVVRSNKYYGYNSDDIGKEVLAFAVWRSGEMHIPLCSPSAETSFLGKRLEKLGSNVRKPYSNLWKSAFILIPAILIILIIVVIMTIKKKTSNQKLHGTSP